MELSIKQIEHIRDNHEEVLDIVIDENIDNDLIYTDDVWDLLREYYDPFALLDGRVTREDLYEQLRDEKYDDEDTYIEVYDRLEEEDQKEIDDLE